MKKKNKIINLGLQGGGAHGAFAWGALDYLLEDGRLDVEGLCATSAGSMNAVVLAQGMLHQDRDEARQMLFDFWLAVSESPKLTSFNSLGATSWLKNTKYSLDNSLFYIGFELMSRLLSPYQFNPFNINPLKTILEQFIDFDALRASSQIKLFICSTNIQTGKVKVFNTEEVTIESVLASACLPYLFQAVEIEGEYYWDGGYVGNPNLFPLIYNCTCPDVVVVHINPINRSELPQTEAEILNRINEISFNSSLMREMRVVAFITKLIESKQAPNLNLKKMYVHSIRDDQEMTQHDLSSKLNTDWDFLTHLRDCGRQVAKTWLKHNFSKIGKESSINIRNEFL